MESGVPRKGPLRGALACLLKKRNPMESISSENVDFSSYGATDLKGGGSAAGPWEDAMTSPGGIFCVACLQPIVEKS